ncbi:MAG: FecR family protein [Stenotrophobium sp.]
MVELRGHVEAAEGTQSRVLSIGEQVYAGSVITTAARSLTTLRFTDDTVLTVGPSSKVTVTAYSYEKAAARMSLQLAKGAFRFLTGLIGKMNHDDVDIHAPVATIGIRGTYFGAEISDTSASVVLLEQPGGGTNAIQVSNAFGAVVVDKPGYGTVVPDAHSPPSPPRRLRLNAVENLTRNVFRPSGVP